MAIHVDEASGNDLIGQGTPEAPYQSMAYALFIKGDVELLVRKDASTPYDKPTPSSLKKAVKGADGLKKKQQKAAENAEREAKVKADAEKKLQESKKIVLTEDLTLPKPAKVCVASIYMHSSDANATIG